MWFVPQGHRVSVSALCDGALVAVFDGSRSGALLGMPHTPAIEQRVPDQDMGNTRVHRGEPDRRVDVVFFSTASGGATARGEGGKGTRQCGVALGRLGATGAPAIPAPVAVARDKNAPTTLPQTAANVLGQIGQFLVSSKWPARHRCDCAGYSICRAKEDPKTLRDMGAVQR